MSFLKPSTKGKRDVMTNEQNNGRIVNTPRFAELGGLSRASGRGLRKNAMSIRKPGSSKG